MSNGFNEILASENVRSFVRNIKGLVAGQKAQNEKLEEILAEIKSLKKEDK